MLCMVTKIQAHQAFQKYVHDDILDVIFGLCYVRGLERRRGAREIALRRWKTLQYIKDLT